MLKPNFITESPTTKPDSEDDVFEADALPSFAKSYILPRKLKKGAVEKQRQQLFSIGPEEEQEEPSEDFKSYKLSMLKTTLQHYDSMGKSNHSPEKAATVNASFHEQVEDLGTLKTLKLVF